MEFKSNSLNLILWFSRSLLIF